MTRASEGERQPAQSRQGLPRLGAYSACPGVGGHGLLPGRADLAERDGAGAGTDEDTGTSDGDLARPEARGPTGQGHWPEFDPLAPERAPRSRRRGARTDPPVDPERRLGPAHVRVLDDDLRR